VRDEDVQAALERHWVASDAEDFAGEREIYEDHAVREYPQSGERIHGRQRIQESRTAQPKKKRFTIQRLLGSGGIWVSEIEIGKRSRSWIYAQSNGGGERK
jgi:hypothetical protein